MKTIALVLVGVLMGATATAHAEPYTKDLARLVAAVERIARAVEKCK